ncbi:MAG: ATP-binding cassette domain-containing protein, partial [Erysipelotrichaceae bacterium]|nr:ATP-binding cassette domain-containing protein [Erysipelotrichaceae bacterium]
LRMKLAELDMGLEDRMDTPVRLLSGGQRQALTLIMATINPPKLLLLDEHTAALDPNSADKVLEITKKIVEENHITCMMITHNMNQALKIGDRTLMLDKGKIIYDISEDKRKNLGVDDLIKKFRKLSGNDLDDETLLN